MVGLNSIPSPFSKLESTKRNFILAFLVSFADLVGDMLLFALALECNALYFQSCYKCYMKVSSCISLQPVALRGAENIRQQTREKVEFQGRG